MLAGVEAELHRCCFVSVETSWETSWVVSANDDAVGFPLLGLPYCSFVTAGGNAHLGVGIGTFILDLHGVSRAGLLASLDADVRNACEAARLNALMCCGPAAWSALRARLTALLREDARRNADREIVEPLLVPRDSVRFEKPVEVGNYTDFYASVHHAMHVGRLFRPDQPLMPNYKWLPVGYHGRVSSLVVSGTEVRRPNGQRRLSQDGPPVFGASTQLDYELEVAAYVGVGNALGEPVAIGKAEERIFGYSLLNDWSARDIQSWEYQPLGPFLGKSFATSVSPWVVPAEALAPFRVPLEARAEGDPEVLSSLQESPESAGIDVTLEVFLSTARMREAAMDPVRLSRGNLRELYWSFGQMIAHHTSNGCNLLAGDLIASGTVSGAEDGSLGCLLEITRRGASPVKLPNGEERTFLEDGDEVVMRGYCQREGLPRISFGECRGRVVAAK